MLTKLKKLLKQIRGLFPEAIPTGMEAFEKWAESFYDTYDNMPTEDRASVKFLLAGTVMHSGPQVAHRSKLFFYLTLKAAAAKQVAGAVFSKIKDEANAKALAESKAISEAANKAV
jgi:hypothetical protein